MSRFLKVNGTLIRDNFGSGKVVNLHGTNLGSWLLREDWMSPLGTTDEYTMRRVLSQRFGDSGLQSLLDIYEDNWFQQKDLENLKAMGLNMIRVPMYWENFMTLTGQMKPDSISFRKLDWLVTQATALNLYVILDLHGLPGNACPWQSGGWDQHNELWTNPTYETWTVKIWQRLAQHYKDQATIASYDLINEPLLTMGVGENPTQVQQKMQFYDRLYQAVRAIDPDHIIQIAAFYDWWACDPPSKRNWVNVVYQTHHYQTMNYDDWTLTNQAIDEWLKNLEKYQTEWNVPIYAGEYSIGPNDLFEKWLSGLNSLNVSWSNWTYKVKYDKNWGFYINNGNPSPNLSQDSYEVIASKWRKFSTDNFQTNTNFINLVQKYSNPETTWISLKGVNQLYVTAEQAGTQALVANRTIVGDWERFQLINNSDGTVSLLAKANQKYVQVDLNNGTRLIASANKIDTWEKFWLTKVNNQVNLKSFINSKFVSVILNNKNLLYCNSPQAKDWETLTIVPA